VLGLLKTAALAVFRRHVGRLKSAGLTAVDTAGEKVAKLNGSPDLSFRPSEPERTFRCGSLVRRKPEDFEAGTP